MEQWISGIQSVLQEEVSAIPVGKLFVAILIACAAGLLVAVVYRFTFGGVLFSKQFALGLILLSMITSIIILAISSNLVLSLGMVGALSIVRFRTAVKEPMDTIFMFWALAAGILVGAGFFLIAILATLFVGLLFILLHAGGKLIKPLDSYLLVLRYDASSEEDVREGLKRLPAARVKSKRSNSGGEELVLELRLSAEQTGLLDYLRKIPAVSEVNLVSNHSDVQL
ncbi:MAG: DUF4956 domain-containing protein [Christensenella sp.]|nr:DUF4956 domain-containing protein [Christensenella sp.]